MVLNDDCGVVKSVSGDGNHLNAAVDVKSHLEGRVAVLLCCVSGPFLCLVEEHISSS